MGRVTRGDALGLAAVVAGVGLAALLRRRRDARAWRDRTVLVTGGSRGLGLVLARELVDRGARVAICARTAGDLEVARRDLEARGGRVMAVVCDVGERADVERAVRQVRDRLGPVDVLVHNAGDLVVGPLDVLDDGDFERSLRVHVWGALHTARAVLPDMRRRGGGRIVNIASIGGRIPIPHMAAYVAAKHALVGLSRSLRVELAREGVAVTTVCPGLMRTGSPVRVRFKGRHREEARWFTVADSLPVLSMDVERAARRILRAVADGRAEAVIGAPGRLAVGTYELSPELGDRAIGRLERLLPDADHPTAREAAVGVDLGPPGGALARPTVEAARRTLELRGEEERP